MTDEAKATKPPPAELAALVRRLRGWKRKSEAKFKRAMEALLKSEKYFRAITQNSWD